MTEHLLPVPTGTHNPPTSPLGQHLRSLLQSHISRARCTVAEPFKSSTPCPCTGPTHDFAGVFLRVAEGDGAVQVNLVVVPDELEDGDVEATGQGHPVLLYANGVVLHVLAPVQSTDGSAPPSCDCDPPCPHKAPHPRSHSGVLRPCHGLSGQGCHALPLSPLSGVSSFPKCLSHAPHPPCLLQYRPQHH